MADKTTCCADEPGEKFFCSINKAFIVDPDIDEVDIIPCLHCEGEQGGEKEDAFVVENHKLGIRSWCIKPLFLFSYNKLIRSRLKGRKDCNLTVTESVQLTRAVLLINAECYTAWNARKEMITSGVLSLKDDWKLSGLVLSKHPRSAETFAHRKWIVTQLEKREGSGEFIRSYLKNELVISLRAAECYADNYTAWSHRAWLVSRFMHDQRKKLLCELHAMRVWAEKHVSDNCAFHYRQCVLKHLKSVCSKTEMLHLLLSELEFVTDLIWTFPGHEVVWYHRNFIYHVWNQWFADVTFDTLLEIASSTSKDSDFNGKLGRSSSSIIPSLTEFDLGSRLRDHGSETFASNTSPLSTPSEIRFCDSVIAKCEGPVGEVQRKCALNYKRRIMLRNASNALKCTRIILDDWKTTTAS